MLHVAVCALQVCVFAYHAGGGQKEGLSGKSDTY